MKLTKAAKTECEKRGTPKKSLCNSPATEFHCPPTILVDGSGAFRTWLKSRTGFATQVSVRSTRQLFVPVITLTSVLHFLKALPRQTNGLKSKQLFPTPIQPGHNKPADVGSTIVWPSGIRKSRWDCDTNQTACVSGNCASALHT